LVYRVTEKIYSKAAAQLAAIIYILYLNNLGLVLVNYTELLFGIFVLSSIYFFISSEKNRNFLLCGLFVGLAIGVRPTGYALIASFLGIYIIQLFRKDYQHKKITLILCGMLVYVFFMGTLSTRNINHFEYTSTTGPANLIMSANPNAKGVYDAHFTDTDSIYKTKKTYYDRNEYLMNQSIQFIKENPFRWVSLIPRKIYSMFIYDGWAVNKVLNREIWDLNNYLKGDSDVRNQFNAEPVRIRLGFWVLHTWQYIIYGLIMVMFLLKLATIKKWISSKHDLLLIIFIISGVSLTILSSIGNARYKYNFIIVGIVAISPLIINLLNRVRDGKNS
jgi:hypothetical protein